MMHVVVVIGGQHFIAFAQWQSLINEREAGGRVRCERDIVGIAANVVGDGAAYLEGKILLRALEEGRFHGDKGIRIQLAAVLLDGLADGPRMRSQIEET